MSKILSALFMLLLIVAFTPSTTHADPIVITSGTLTVTGLVGGPRYTLSGNNFSASGGGDRGALGLQAQAVFTTGSVVNVGANFVGSSLEPHGGFFIFTGPPITVPFSLATLTITSPFEFSGTLLTCPGSCFLGPVISRVDLVGSGTATFTALFSGLTANGTPIYTFGSITYNFEVPEPASVLLLGGGLAALGAALRRRCRTPR
jgi:hypothetical protein